MVAFSFSTQGINPGYGVGGGLPVGKHPVVVNSVSLEGTTAGTGGKMVIALEIIDGPAKGVKGNEQLTLQHQNPVTVRIAQEQLTSICIVAGLPGGIQNDTAELHGKTFVVEVAPQKKEPQYTEVVNVFTMDGLTAKEVLQGGNGGGNAGANGSFAGNNNAGQQNNGGNNNGGGNGGGWGNNNANQGGGQPDNSQNNNNNGNNGGWQQGGGNTGGEQNNQGGNPGWGAR
jgi:hypothetical protein